MLFGKFMKRKGGETNTGSENQEDSDLLKEMSVTEEGEEAEEELTLTDEEAAADDDISEFNEMQQLILTDEKDLLMTHLKGYRKKHRKAVNKRYFFISDSSFTADYLMRALVRVLRKPDQAYDRLFYFMTGDETEERLRIIDALKIRTVHFEEDSRNLFEDGDSWIRRHGDIPYIRKEFRLGNSIVFIFVDCTDPAAKDKIRALTDAFFARQEEDGERAKCVVSLLMPEIPAFPGELTALTERELDYYLEEKAEKTPEIRYYLDTMRYFRDMQTQHNANVALIRFANVFGCRYFHTPAFDMQAIIREAAEKGSLHASEKDQAVQASFTYLPDACFQIFRMAFQGKKGNEYNGFGESYSAGDMKEKIHILFPEEVAYSADYPAGPLYKGYAIPDTLKIRRLKIAHTCTANQALKHAAAFIADYEYDNSQNVNFYRGKIDEIQKLEIVVLQEIDRICRKYDIKYFLAGGTLLGAVRNGQPISWDDDLDIGMLRGDFDKFRKVCEKELGENFTYSSPYNGSGSHYVLDKVRLKDTYFSTNFSAYQSGIEDGIFIDVLVYDQTSSRPYFQHLQTRSMDLIYKLILLKWFNAPRGKHKKLCRFLLPILRHTPWKLLHKPFDFVARLYRNKKDAVYLIDSVGKKLMDGPLYLEGLEDTVYVDFAGIKAPIPVNPEPYLIYAYGPGYMQKPPLSKRKCPHGFGRIDLGGYVLGEGAHTMRRMNLEGELFEGELTEAQ